MASIRANDNFSTSLQVLGRCARSHDDFSARFSRYCFIPFLRLISRLTVDDAQSSEAAIVRTD